MTYHWAFAESTVEPVNLASFANGGRIESASSDGYGNVPAYLLDGNPETQWETAYGDKTREVVLSFFDGREALLDAAVLHPGAQAGSQAIKEFELLLSDQPTGDDFQSAGVFALTQEAADQRFDLAGKRARRLKLKVLSTYGGDRCALTELKILEAGAPEASLLKDAFAQPVAQEALSTRTNLVYVRNGSRVVSASSQAYDYLPQRLLDGHATDERRWEGYYKDLQPELTFAFFEDRLAVVDGVVIHPGEKYPDYWVRELELWASTTEPDSSFERIGRFILKKESSHQLIPFPPRPVKYLKVKCLTRYGRLNNAEGCRIAELMVLEHPEPGKPSILEGAFAQLVSAETLALARDLLSPSLGGRIVSASSSGYSSSPPAHLVDGKVDEYNYWEGAYKDPQPEIVVSFFDDRAAWVDGVVLHTGSKYSDNWPRDVELWASLEKSDSGFKKIGRFLLKEEAGYHRLFFPPTQAKYLKVKFLGRFGRLKDAEQCRAGELMVLESKEEGNVSILEDVLTQPLSAHSIAGGVNVAFRTLGGKVEDASSSYDDKFKPDNLIDGMTGSENSWAPAKDQAPPHEIVFSFLRQKAAWIDKVVLDPRHQVRNTATVKDFEIWVSQEASGESFTKAGRFLAPNQMIEQAALLPKPVLARRVKLKILSAHDEKLLPALAEVMILEAPSAGPSVLSDLKLNLADRSLGFSLVRFTSQGSSGQERWMASQLFNPAREPEGWASSDNKFPQDLVFGFGLGQRVLLRRVILEAPPVLETRPKQFSLRTSLESPVRGLKTIGEEVYDFDPSAAEQVVEFDPPMEARYLMLRILSNQGGRVTGLKAIRMIEAQAPGYLSLATRLGQVGGSRPGQEEEEAVSSVEEGARPEKEPNDSPAQADPVALEEKVAGKIDPPQEVDYYRLDLARADRNILNLELTGRPYLRTSLALSKEADPSWTKQFTPEKASGQQAQISWKFEPASYLLKVSEPKSSLVLIYDTSGSMQGSQQDLEAAVASYAKAIQKGEEMAVVRFSNKSQRLCDFTDEPAVLVKALEGQFTPNGGTSLFDALRDGIALLEGRLGNRAIILMTDGMDSTSSTKYTEIWSVLEGLSRSNIRLYTIGMGQDLKQYTPAIGATGGEMLAHFAAATGGRFFYAPTSKELVGLYEEISRELRMITRYTLTTSLGGGEGGLRLIEAGERIQGVGAPTIVEFILDASGSMSSSRGMKGGKKKITVAKEVLSELIRSMPEDYRLALRVYGHRFKGDKKDSELLFSPTEGNRDPMLKKIAAIQPVGLTPIAYSLTQVISDLANLPGEKLVILVSDGEETGGGDPVKAAQQLHFMGVGVKVNVVGFDIAEQKVQEQMRQIAAMGGGQYYGAKNSDELIGSLRQALRASFKIFDDSGEEMATGQIGEGEVKLPAGRYKVVVRPEDPITVEGVEVRHKAVTEVKIKKEGDRIQTEWRIP